jgi:PAS domain S-box-containing protein
MAESRETTREVGVRLVAYHDGSYDVAPDLIAAELESCHGVALDRVRGLGDGGSTAYGLPVVFADTPPSAMPPDERPGMPVVWVTETAAVVREALDGDALDAILWSPADGWETLAAKLEAVAARPETRLKQPTKPPDSTTATQVEVGGPSVDAEDTALYEYLVRTVGDAVYILDDEGRFTFVNDALCDLSGYDREELLGSSVHIIKDDETVAEAEEALRDLLRESGTADAFDVAKLDVELITKDGEHVPCTDRMTLRPSDEEDNLTGTVGTLRDVSRQQRREDILGGMLEATQEMVGASTTDEVARLVTETAVDVLDIDLVTLREHDPETETLEVVSVSDAAAERLPDRPVYDVDEGLVGEAFSTGELLVSTDLADAGVRNPGDMETAAYVPLGDRRVLSLGRPGEGGFDDDELRFLELLAATAGSVFERVERGEQLRRYEAVVETAEEMLFTTDAEGRFALVTTPLAAYLGHDRDSLTGLPAGDVFADDAVVSDVAEDPTANAYETTMRTADGDLLPSRVTVTPIEDGTDSGVVGTVQDISELRSAKREASRQRRRFRELFDTLDDPVADIEYEDGEAVVRSANPSFGSLCDLDEEGVPDTPLSAVRASLPGALGDALVDVETPSGSLERSVEVRTDEGRRYFLLRTVTYEGDDGERAFLIFTDVTELERRGTHLTVLQRLLRHNLRTETTVIQGYAETLTDEDSRAVREAGERIREASRSLVQTSDTAHTIQQVLRGDDSREVVDAADLWASLSETLSVQFPDEDVAVVGDPDAAVRISDDLHTAVEELVDNAVTHAAPDPTVTVGLDDADGELRVAVSDDGPGIPDDEWDVVAGDREITQLQHTSGLGLWLVKWIADRHGGRLLRTDGDGAEVTLCLPTV